MKFVVHFAVLPALVAPPWSEEDPVAVRARFTDAQIQDSVRGPLPADALPAAPGRAGEGVDLREPVAIENPLLRRANGYISFWIPPQWNGDDGPTHRILHIGDPECNGPLVEEAATGVLRLVMASPEELTASRADVSHYKTGEWHHVTITWFSKDGAPLGLPLWIDPVAVAGPVAGRNTSLGPWSMPNRPVWIGDAPIHP